MGFHYKCTGGCGVSIDADVPVGDRRCYYCGGTLVAIAPEPVEAVKHDGEKLPLHLLPPDALEAIAEILAFGAKKYAPRNWEKGMAWSRIYRACLGHLFAWFMRRGPDAETGKSHLWHAGCCILFLITYELRNVGQDDRPQA